MTPWTCFPYAGEYSFDAQRTHAQWARLHQGDDEPCPADPAVLQAWALYHSGDFERAAAAGLAAGGAGLCVFYKATSVHANYLERSEKTRLDLLGQVAERARAQAAAEPGNASAWYWHAYALGRYSQGVSVAKALAQGLGGKVKDALEKAVALSPRHADARIALGTFHAEVIDKVGALIGGMTYGARKCTGLRLFREGLALNPHSAMALVEYAQALVMLGVHGGAQEATALYEQAAACVPLDAKERLDVELARAELAQEQEPPRPPSPQHHPHHDRHR